MSIYDLNYERVHFRKTALRTVVAQLRFNQLFKIGVHAPVEFQESVRGWFPAVETTREAMFSVRIGGGEDVPLQPEAEGGTVWRFKSPDGTWIAALSSSSLSLETTAYERFDEFESMLNEIVRALTQHYGIDSFTRIGLRYINIFEGSTSNGWFPKLNHSLLGPLSDEYIGDLIHEAKQQFVISDEDWTIGIRHGIETPSSYRLDLDHATTTVTSPQQAQARVKEFERRIYQVFRWAISDELFAEMEPIPDDA